MVTSPSVMLVPGTRVVFTCQHSSPKSALSIVTSAWRERVPFSMRMDHDMTVTYGFEHERRLRAGFVGCGGPSFRNVYPVLRYLPVDLVAVCDLDANRAKAYAERFGAER